MARDLTVLRLAIALTQVHPPPSPPPPPPPPPPLPPSPFIIILFFSPFVYVQTEHVIDGVSLLGRLHSLGFTHDATLENM